MNKICLNNFDNSNIERPLVFTNGCFDILHLGHLDYLKKAKSLGKTLVVGLNSDNSIKKLKGESRPINNYEYRSKFLSYFDFVDFIVEFNEETPLNLIHKIKPDVLVKGGDYLIDEIVGSDYVLSYGGLVKTIDIVFDYSTTSLLKKLKI